MEAVVGETPEQVLADAGYASERELSQLEKRKIAGYVALGRERRNVPQRDAARHPASARMAARLRSEQCRAAYAERKWLAEAPFGWIKNVLGFRRFSVRGLKKVRGEWFLVCLALNLRRLNGSMVPG